MTPDGLSHRGWQALLNGVDCPERERASAVLYERIGRFLSGFRQQPDYLDMVQGAVLAVLIRLRRGSFDPERAGSFWAWTQRLVHRHAIDWWRRLRTQGGYLENLIGLGGPWGVEGPVPGGVEVILEGIGDGLFLEAVEEALATCSQAEREVMQLWLCDLDATQIAAVRGAVKATVTPQVSRARAKVCAHLARLGYIRLAPGIPPGPDEVLIKASPEGHLVHRSTKVSQ